MNNFKTACIVIMTLINSCVNVVLAQHQLSGVIMSDHGVPLPYSTISIKNSTIGTIANSNGVFDFFISKENNHDTIVISMLGYEPLEVRVSDVNKVQNNKFYLKERMIVLDEVTILVDSRSAEDILKEAFRRQKDNAPQSDFALQLFIRELFYFNDTCYAIVESAGELYGEKYPRQGLDIYLDQTRHAIGNEPDYPSSLTDYNPFRDFGGMIGGKSHLIKPCKDCNYEIEGYSYLDDQEVAIISLNYQHNIAKPSYYRYTIGLDDYAILKFEFETNVSFGNAFVQHFDSITSSLVSLKRTIDYKKAEGHYYLNSYRQQISHKYQNIDKSIWYQTTHKFSVVVNSVENRNVKELKAKENDDHLMDYQTTLFNQIRPIDKSFWQNYNMLKRTSDENHLYQDISGEQ